jgi:hypothetical protein
VGLPNHWFGRRGRAVLNYNVAYHLHCELDLRSGRRVTLQVLQQWMTYGGWMEGVPSAEWNDRKVEGAIREAGAKPLLIPPVRRDYLRKPGDMDGHTSFRGRVPEWLPMVTCVGRFQDTRPARDQSKHLSVLAVVWFQDEFAMPIDAGVLEQLRAVDWEQAAEDVEV